jgi:hypothetical protein
MKQQEAEIIINSYGSVLARGTKGGIARKLSWLPCSIGKMRLAFYVYLKELIARNALTQTLGGQLKNAYQGLNHFIADDDADTINSIHHQIKSKGQETLSESQQELYRQFLQRIGRIDDLFEINSYINECFGQRDNQDFILQKS